MLFCGFFLVAAKNMSLCSKNIISTVRDTKTQEGQKDTGGTQRHRRDTKTQEGYKDTGGHFFTTVLLTSQMLFFF